MGKWFDKLMKICIAATLIIGVISVAGGSGEVYADEAKAEFEADSELIRALMESNTFILDDNEDGMLSLEEMADCYGIQIDCADYDIKDWSALKYGKDWKFVAIYNVRGIDLSFLGELENLTALKISCEDFSKVTGMDKLDSIRDITIESGTDVDLSVIGSCFSGLRMDNVSITAPKITNHAALGEMEIYSLSLGGDSKEGLDNIPKISFLEKLTLNYRDITDADMKQIASVNQRLKWVSVTGAQISGLNWIHDLQYLYVLDIRRNLIRDIRPILEHKNIEYMDIYIDGNPYVVDAEDMYVEHLLKLDESISGVAGEEKFYNNLVLGHREWSCDLVGDLMFYCEDTNVADVDSYYIYFKSKGTTVLHVTDGKNVNLRYPISVEGNTNVAPKPTEEPEDIQLGDADLNGKINARDALLALKNAARLLVLSDSAMEVADIDNDNNVTAIDARYILEYVAGLISSLDFAESDVTPAPTDAVITNTPVPTPKPTTGYENIDSINIDFEYGNSFIVEIESKEIKNYTTEDFSTVGLTDVWTIGKNKTEEGYIYKLLMVLDEETCNDDVLEDAMEKVKTYENVISAEYNEYIEHETIIDLNYQEYEIKVGESISLYIDKYRPYNASTHAVGLLVKFNSAVSLEELEKYGVADMNTNTSVFPATEEIDADYLIPISGGILKGTNMFTVVHLLSQLPEVDCIWIASEVYPTGNRYTEYWEISDESVASMELVGGKDGYSFSSSSITKLDQSATITGIAPGETVISVTKQGWGDLEGTGTCVIRVVEE